MSGHTPGPWRSVNPEAPIVVADSEVVLAGHIAGPARIAPMGGARHTGVEEARANANLIAAAPDLLAACEALLEDAPFVYSEDNCECGEFVDKAVPHPHCRHTRAATAIAKARGGK